MNEKGDLLRDYIFARVFRGMLLRSEDLEGDSRRRLQGSVKISAIRARRQVDVHQSHPNCISGNRMLHRLRCSRCADCSEKP